MSRTKALYTQRKAGTQWEIVKQLPQVLVK